jgi:hypothetical protein
MLTKFIVLTLVCSSMKSSIVPSFIVTCSFGFFSQTSNMFFLLPLCAFLAFLQFFVFLSQGLFLVQSEGIHYLSFLHSWSILLQLIMHTWREDRTTHVLTFSNTDISLGNSVLYICGSLKQKNSSEEPVHFFLYMLFFFLYVYVILYFQSVIFQCKALSGTHSNWHHQREQILQDQILQVAHFGRHFLWRK